jgi:curved DNA-binding protein CbpA
MNSDECGEFCLFGLSVAYDLDKAQLYDRYREAQKKWHPDRPDGDSAKSAAIAAAYSKLADDTERALLIIRHCKEKIPDPTSAQLETWMGWFEASDDHGFLSWLKNHRVYLVEQLKAAFAKSDMKRFAVLYLEAKYASRVLECAPVM